MVKGNARQVIVVKTPDTRLFEQAIFILKEDAPAVGDRELMKEACRAADEYLRSRTERTPARLWLRRTALLLAGAGATGAAWLLSAVLF